VTGAGSLFDTSGSTLNLQSSNTIRIANGGELRVQQLNVQSHVFTGLTAVEITDGGELDIGVSDFNFFAATDAVITNNGGIYEFSERLPGINTSAGGATGCSIDLTDGTLSFRDIADANVHCSTLSPLNGISYAGENTYRLNNATSSYTSQNYTFETGLGPDHFTRGHVCAKRTSLCFLIIKLATRIRRCDQKHGDAPHRRERCQGPFLAVVRGRAPRHP